MKIWQLVDGRLLGGIERHVATLVTALLQRGYEAEAVLWRDYADSPWREQLAASGVPFRYLGGSAASLVSALARSRPALVHTHGYKANLIGRLVARLMGIPVVSSFHSGERSVFPVSAYVGADMALSFLAPRIAISEEIARRLPWPAQVVRNFLIVPERAPAGPLPNRVGFVGRLSHEKGPDLFCEIAALSPPDIAFDIWGDGPMRRELEARYADRVTFHGLTLDVTEAFGSIGLLLMPSRAEGLPMAALEALAAGVPVSASRVGGLPDLITHGESGWLFDAGDVGAASRHVTAWRGLGAGAANTIRAQCHAIVRERFSDHAVLPEILAVYARAGLTAGRTTTTAASRGASASLN
ncbi:MAG: glycosyltransferase family 4 protein [Hyphomicrobiaceae bacterium]